MIRVLLAEDENLIRGALASLLSLEEDIEVVAQASTGKEAVAMACKHAPDVAVLDLLMPQGDGISVTQAIAAKVPSCRCLIVTSHGAPGNFKRALAAGVMGFASKNLSARDLADIIRTVHAGRRYVEPSITANAIKAGESPLTAREADILHLASDGAPVSEVAERAVLTPGTVRNYLSSAISKLGVSNRHEAVSKAREHGWIR
ncbi:DNA-binding response regulator [Streptomyces fuscichromogenes]|uniref:DNA-binding response regulator n=1 Tax=Streptomyces fuscichromogenes TaxID=1324013 RepID=A0A917XFB5_9ACTN|nr:DNA-binding response regulator [Streptomyces fuscichromogenes]